MNIDDPTGEGLSERRDESRPASSSGWNAGPRTGSDDHVEVLVEDLFIEEYQVPLSLAPEHSALRGKSRLGAAGKIRTRAKPLLGGLLALGGLALATLFLTGRRRKVSALHRLFLKMGIAR